MANYRVLFMILRTRSSTVEPGEDKTAVLLKKENCFTPAVVGEKINVGSMRKKKTAFQRAIIAGLP